MVYQGWSLEREYSNLIFRFSISTIVYQARARYLVPVPPVLVGTSGTIVLVAGSSSIFFSQKTKNPTLNYMYVVQNDTCIYDIFYRLVYYVIHRIHQSLLSTYSLHSFLSSRVTFPFFKVCARARVRQ